MVINMFLEIRSYPVPAVIRTAQIPTVLQITYPMRTGKKSKGGKKREKNTQDE